MNEKEQSSPFCEIHRSLPGEGPGDRKATERSFAILAGLLQNPLILNLGCGPGMQTLHLTHLTQGWVLAVDNHIPYLDQLIQRVTKEGLSERTQALAADMRDPPFVESGFDLIRPGGSIIICLVSRGYRQSSSSTQMIRRG